MHYIIIICTFFILVGAALPFINDEFNGNVTSELQLETINTQVGSSQYFKTDESSTSLWDKLLGIGSGTISAVTILFSIASMLLWNPFAGLWLNLLLFMPMRLYLGILIYRQLRSGGG